MQLGGSNLSLGIYVWLFSSKPLGLYWTHEDSMMMPTAASGTKNHPELSLISLL